ncbi:MAG: M3 family oligoendopeptidase [Nitrososphaerota archaeon]|jgi:oligoendopeptidase F|uniref:M3 family oligoendopeptidase n=1 Tax=Candidatus Bathycorpusculum sp. TaxID=2994959 RepID=UPI00281A13CB|nr:M3 family oligoendopeptidase [Candidatus Termiticorpusculum sp.]MCL2173187.1 M3 family oligoendopeptidase [Candidatus Termiticorpusculum sp.]MCL2256845.1 M3 family oligoendopeptidase [Candidatus Termiticorpusculum sp.]MCL2293038.1 M3 family oligoendopeptidase [Candidatus Termiticorpusculum sp.]MDR0459829.1 M3 family oligoendopeptidase [Nitrososphaerota archaeon]
MQQIVWDLSELFSNIDDPKISQTISNAIAMANSFEKKYRGKILHLPPKELLCCLQEVEVFNQAFSNVGLYSSLVFAADMTLSDVQVLNDKVCKLEAKIGKQLAFYRLELSALLKSKPQFICEPVLANYRHLLERVYRRVEHQLSEVEEQLVIEKDQFGVNAWEDLQSKWLNTRTFEVTAVGEKKLLSYGEANGLIHHPDRATRESANRSIYGLLGKDGEIFSSALRNICNDWVSISKRRKYQTPMEASLINNDTEQAIIDNLLASIAEGAKTYRQYLKIKAQFLDLPVLGNHDLVAPLPGVSELKFTFSQAQDLIVRAYNRFDPDYAEAVEEMFAKRHIDATPRFGKRNGAFCASFYNGKSAYILQSFNGTLSDVFTLAHELGHATHDWYMERSQTPLNVSVPSIVAETASIFSELLLTDLLLAEAKSDAERRAVLCLVLDEAGMTAFQVTARVWFEQALYRSVEQEEFLDYKTICNHWTRARDRIFGDAVEWFPEMEAEWTMKPHYYMANYRFYNYPYVYAQMFVYALYERYLAEGKLFVPKFKTVLSAGSSLSPLEIAQIVQLNPKTPDFWHGGLKVFEGFLQTLKKIK